MFFKEKYLKLQGLTNNHIDLINGIITCKQTVKDFRGIK